MEPSAPIPVRSRASGTAPALNPVLNPVLNRWRDDHLDQRFPHLEKVEVCEGDASVAQEVTGDLRAEPFPGVLPTWTAAELGRALLMIGRATPRGLRALFRSCPCPPIPKPIEPPSRPGPHRPSSDRGERGRMP